MTNSGRNARAKEIRAMSFEEAVGQLEEIVQRLESGDVALQDSIDLFARGGALRAHCEGKLEEARERIEKVTGGRLEPMDDSATGSDPEDSETPF